MWFVYPSSLAVLDVSEDWSMLRNLPEYASLLCVHVCVHMCVHADRSEGNWAVAFFPPLWVPLGPRDLSLLGLAASTCTH